MNSRISQFKYHILMVFLVTVWGMEWSIAKDALDHVDTLLLMNVKYFFGALLIAFVAKKMTGFRLPELKDLPFIIGSTFLGHIVYLYSEYVALDTVPIANITVIYGFLPIGTILVEKLLFHRRLSIKLLLLMILGVIGIALTIGTDLGDLAGGKAKGYLMCVVALLAWLGYLFLTESTTEKYGSITVALYQASLAWCMTAPLAAPKWHTISQLPPQILLELLYLGLISEGVCFIIEVTGLERLGSTICAVYSNFLPVTSAFFGLILLHQDLILLQYIGGFIVIVSGFFVIREKDYLDRLSPQP